MGKIGLRAGASRRAAPSVIGLAWWKAGVDMGLVLVACMPSCLGQTAPDSRGLHSLV